MHLPILALSGLAALALSGPAAAAVVTETSRMVSASFINDFGGLDIDQRIETFPGPATPTSISARVETRLDQMQDPWAPATPGFASAAIGPGGLSDIILSGITTGSNFGSLFLTATVEDTASVLIPTLVTDYTVYFSFDLFNMAVEFWDSAGLGDDDEPIRASFGYSVYLDGIQVFDLGVRLEGTRDGAEIGIGCTLGLCPGIVPEATGPGDVPRIQNFLPFSRTDLRLGTVNADTAGETFEIRTVMSASLLVPEFTLSSGGRVSISDPNSLALQAEGLVRLEPVARVPLPGAGPVLAGALGLLAVARRRAADRGRDSV